MVLYFLLTTYNSNAFSLLLTPYSFTTYYLTTYYFTTLLLTTYYLTTLLLTPYSCLKLSATSHSSAYHSRPNRWVSGPSKKR